MDTQLDKDEPLRQALDRLRDVLATTLEQGACAARSKSLHEIDELLVRAQQIQSALCQLETVTALIAAIPQETQVHPTLSEAPRVAEEDGTAHPVADPESTVKFALVPVSDQTVSESERTPDKSPPTESIPVQLKAAATPAEKETSNPAARRVSNDEVKAFCAQVRNLEKSDFDPIERQAAIKALVCRGKALLERCGKSSDYASTIRQEIGTIKELWNAGGPGDKFFGFNSSRSHGAQVWELIAEAYDYLDNAEMCVTWLESLAEDEFADRKSLVEKAAAAETLLRKRLTDGPAGIVDLQQVRLRERLASMGRDFYVWAWAPDAKKLPSEEKLVQAAKGLADEFTATRKHMEADRHRSTCWTELLTLLNEATQEMFEENLADALERCLAAGIRTTDKKLVEVAAPYRHLLIELGRPALKRFIEHLNAKATLIQVKGFVPQDPELEPDPDHEQRLAELKLVTKGKCMLLVGGNKGQTHRHEKIQEVLELAELQWPDVEETSNVKLFNAAIPKADIVCLIIRWSRHSYKSALDEAKKQNKLTATLARGIGINRMVYDLHQQLCRDSELNRKEALAEA